MKRYVYNTLTGVAAQDFTIKPDFECWELTEQIENDLLGKVKPKIIDGVVVETATQEEILQANAPVVPATVSSLRFWLAVLDTLNITKQYIISQVEQIQDVGMRTRILVMLGEAQEFDRSNQFLNQMANMLGIDQALLDQIFITASNYQL